MTDQKNQNTDFAITHYLLSAFYFIFFIYCAGRFLCKNRPSKSSKNRRWRNIFNFFMIAASAIRTISFLLQALASVGEIVVSNFVDSLLNVMPTALFFTSYWIMLLLWALIYHGRYNVNANFVDRSIPLFVMINFAMYSAITTSLVMNYKDSAHADPARAKEPNALVTVALGAIAFCYFCTALAAYFYGIRFYRIFVLHVAPIAQRILQLTLFFGSIFLIRTVIVCYGIFDNISKYFWFDLVYYMSLEILPLNLMLALLQKTSSLEKKNSLLHTNSNPSGSYITSQNPNQNQPKTLQYSPSFAAM